MQLDHINIKAPQSLIEIEKDFYLNILGLNLGNRANFNHSGYWLYNDNNQSIIHLSIDENRTQNLGYFDHFALKSSGLKKFIDTLTVNNINYDLRYLDDINITQIFIYSPLGVRIEISFAENIKNTH